MIIQTPSSPSHYQQPPTPEHPPPNAVQAENVIHDRIRPLSQVGGEQQQSNQQQFSQNHQHINDDILLNFSIT